MRYVTIMILISLASPGLAADDDRQQLVGTWAGGVESGAKGHKLTITETTITGVQNETKDLGEGTFVIDKSQKPWHLDATATKGRAKGSVYSGIYEIKKDTLRWCVATPGKDRPSKFDTKGSQFLLVLEKQP